MNMSSSQVTQDSSTSQVHQPRQTSVTTQASTNSLSSTLSIQQPENHHFLITDASFQQTSLLSSTTPDLLASMPTSSTEPSSFVSFIIHLAFIILFVLVTIFVLIQCSHFVLYIARQVFKNRNSGILQNNNKSRRPGGCDFLQTIKSKVLQKSFSLKTLKFKALVQLQ